MPSAKSYWVQAQARQWPDGSGSRVRVMIDADGEGQYWCETRTCWMVLYYTLKRYLKKLGCKPGRPKTIYFRLLYE